jgi:hypothetical protein
VGARHEVVKRSASCQQTHLLLLQDTGRKPVEQSKKAMQKICYWMCPRQIHTTLRALSICGPSTMLDHVAESRVKLLLRFETLKADCGSISDCWFSGLSFINARPADGPSLF